MESRSSGKGELSKPLSPVGEIKEVNHDPGENPLCRAILAFEEQDVKAHRVGPPQPVTERSFECELLDADGTIIGTVRFEAADIRAADNVTIKAQAWVDERRGLS